MDKEGPMIEIGLFSSSIRNTECLHALPDKEFRHSHISGYYLVAIIVNHCQQDFWAAISL